MNYAEKLIITYTAQELAAILCMARNTVYQQRRKGDLPSGQKHGSRRLSHGTHRVTHLSHRTVAAQLTRRVLAPTTPHGRTHCLVAPQNHKTTRPHCRHRTPGHILFLHSRFFKHTAQQRLKVRGIFNGHVHFRLWIQ